MPTAETEHYLNEASKVKNKANSRGRLLEPAKRYLRHHEREKRKEESRRLKDMLTPMNVNIAKLGEQSIAQARKHLNDLEDDLEANSPPTDLSGQTRDALYAELKREEEIYRQGMVPHEEMRRNPVGAVDRHIRHERANKDRALKIKNLRILLNPESDEQDLCNLEDLRPHIVLPNGQSSFMGDAQIPGVFAMTPQAKENWPENMPEFGTANSPLKQAEERESREAELQARIDRLEKELADKVHKLRNRRNENQIQRETARMRMKEYWRKKKEQEALAKATKPEGE